MIGLSAIVSECGETDKSGEGVSSEQKAPDSRFEDGRSKVGLAGGEKQISLRPAADEKLQGLRLRSGKEGKRENLERADVSRGGAGAARLGNANVTSQKREGRRGETKQLVLALKERDLLDLLDLCLLVIGL